MIENLLSVLNNYSLRKKRFNSVAIENYVAETQYLLQLCAPKSNLW